LSVFKKAVNITSENDEITKESCAFGRTIQEYFVTDQLDEWTNIILCVFE